MLRNLLYVLFLWAMLYVIGNLVVDAIVKSDEQQVRVGHAYSSGDLVAIERVTP